MNSLVLRFRALVLCDVLLCFGGSAVAQEPSTAPAEVLTLDQAVTLAQENNRLVKIDQAVFDRRIQKSQYIRIGIHYLFFSPFTIQGLPQNVNALGITLKWDLYDWGYKRHLLDEKQRTIEQSKLNLTETKSQVVLDLDNRFRKLREARAAVQVANTHLQQALAAFWTARSDFEKSLGQD